MSLSCGQAMHCFDMRNPARSVNSFTRSGLHIRNYFFISSHLFLHKNFLEPTSQLQRLTWSALLISDIIYTAAAQSAAEFRSSCNLKAAPHVESAVALTQLLKMWLTSTSSISMVAQAGQPSGWPVAFRTGTANLVWATTKGFRSSRGSD